MYRPSSGRSSLSSSSRYKESSSSSGSRSSRSGASTSGPTRDRSPRRSPSPRGRRRRHRSPSSSRSSRRSPSPRRPSRARSPSGGSRSRRRSEQRDESLSRRLSPGRHPQFASRHSPSRHSKSSEEQSLQPAVDDDCYGIDPLERRRRSDRVGSPVDSLSPMDRSDFTDYLVFRRCLSCPQSHERYSSPEGSPPSSFNRRKHSYLSEERGQEPKCCQYDREDRLPDVNMDCQDLLNYYKRILSRSPNPRYPDEDFTEFENSRSKKNTCQDMPGSGYVIPGLTDFWHSEPQFLHMPEKAPAMPKKSILKKRVDDPSVQVENFLKCFNKNAVAESANKESQACVDDWRAFFGLQRNAYLPEQNFGSFLREKEYQELTSESADLHGDFLLPHERASQDGSGISHILGRMADSTSTQEKKRHDFLDVEDEEKFLYGDDEDDSNINCPSTEMLTVNDGERSVSLNRRPLSPIPSVKPDSLEESRIEYEKIHDLLKTIGLDIGVVETGKGAARTQEQLHGKKTLRSVDGPSYKADSSEKDSIQSNTHSSESDQKNALSPCGSSLPSNGASSAPISKHAQTLEYDNSAGPPEQCFPSVSVIPPAPASLPNLPPPPPPVSQYSLSHFTAFLAAHVLRNYPPPTMPPPSYNAYGHGMAYSTSAWPMHAPPQQSNPVLPDVHGLASVTVPPRPTQSNFRVMETVSTIKENPENKRNKSVLVEVPVTPTDSSTLSQSSSSVITERISDGKNLASEKPQVIEEGEKLMSEQERQQEKLAYLRTELHRRCKQQWHMLRNKSMNRYKANVKKKDPLLVEVNIVQENIVKEISQLLTELNTAEMKQSHLDSVSHITGINSLEKSWKKASESVDSSEEEKAKNKETCEKTSNSIKECLNKNPLDEERGNVDHRAKWIPIPEIECSLKRKYCEKQKEDRDNRNAKVARKEESAITKELGEEVDENEINKCKEGSCDQKTETNNQHQDQDVAAPKAETTEEGKRRESKSQSGNPNSKQKVTVTKTQNLGMSTKGQKTARVAKAQQHSRSFGRPPFTLPPGTPLSLVATSPLDKPAPAPGIKSSDASTKLLPVVKKGNLELVISPNTAKALRGETVILKDSQENGKLQEQVEMQSQESGSVSDIREHARVQKQEVIEAETQKFGATKEWAILKTVKMSQELQTSQTPHPPSLMPGPLSLLSLQLRPSLSSVPARPHPPWPQFPLTVSGPANKGHSLLGLPPLLPLPRRPPLSLVHALPRPPQPDNKGAVGQPGRRRIVICGHSMIFWAAHRAERTAFGSQLGLSELAIIEWWGRRGMHWPRLLHLLFEERWGPPPDILLVHLGGDDLGLMKGMALVIQALEDLAHIQARWPGVHIVWSAILPRLVWRNSTDPRCIDRVRRKVNRQMQKAMEGGLGTFLPHPEINVGMADLYRDDGIHMSNKGNVLFLKDIQQGIRLVLGM